MPTANFFLRDKVEAAHWAAHNVIEQPELPIGSQWSDIN